MTLRAWRRVARTRPHAPGVFPVLHWFGRHPERLVAVSVVALVIQGTWSGRAFFETKLRAERYRRVQHRLEEAALLGDIARASEALESGADINAPAPAPPLHLALVNGCMDMASYLLDRGADPNQNGYVDSGDVPPRDHYPVVIAVRTSRILDERRPIMITLLARHSQQHGHPLAGTDCALRYALAAGRPPAVIAALLAAGASPDIAMADGQPALTYSLDRRQPNIAGLLVAAGATRSQ